MSGSACLKPGKSSCAGSKSYETEVVEDSSNGGECKGWQIHG